MQKQDTNIRADDTWIGTLVGIGLLILHIYVQLTEHTANYGLILFVYGFIALLTVLQGWSKGFFWSMTISAAVAFALWNAYLLIGR